MVKILKDVPKQSRIAGMGEALSGLGAAYMQQRQQKDQQRAQQLQMQHENESIKKQHGIDLSGIVDPKERQLIISEMLKRGGKEELLNKKLEGLRSIFNKKQSGRPSIGDQLSGKETEEPQSDQIEQQINPSQISDEDILTLSAIDPAMAREARAAKDTALQQQTNLRKEIGSSYKENQKFIDKTYDQYEDSLRKEAIIERMNQLDESGEMSSSGVVNLLESLGMKPEWLQNPANEEYTKLGLDLLGGGTLQADYGSRVLQSEFKVAQQRIPTLMQTSEGRRQISENIKAMLLPSKLKQERLQYYIDKSERTGEPLPHNLRGKILKDIKPQLEEAYDKFQQRNGRYKVKEGTKPDNNALEKYYYLGNADPVKIKKMMKEDGYDIGGESTSRTPAKRKY